MKLGIGKTARVIESSRSYLGFRREGPEYMCCFCGDTVSQITEECRSCGVTLKYGSAQITEVEQRDIQINNLKGSVASAWDFKGFLLERLMRFERGDTDIPDWPAEYGGKKLGAQGWFENNGWSKGRKGETLPPVVETFEAYGKGGLDRHRK